MKSKALTYAGWLFVWLLIFYFIYSNAIRYFDSSFPVYTPEFRPFAPFLIIHIVGGMAALLLGPFQFFTRIRTKLPRVHRTIGKVYLLAILISGSTAAYLCIFDNIIRKHEFTFGTGTLGLAFAWFITSGMAYYAIKNKNVLQHQEWMLRSYVVTFGFVFFRIIYLFLSSIEQFAFKDELGGAAAWGSWSIPLLFTEWLLQAKKIKTKQGKKTAPQDLPAFNIRLSSMAADETQHQHL